MNEKQVAYKIIDLIGGKQNIVAVEHCATRLRLVLKDEGIAKNNGAKIEDIEGVKGQFFANKQYQIILGTGFVDKVYDVFTKELNLDDNASVKQSAFDNMNIGQKFTRVIADVFIPIIPILVATGLFLGLSGLIQQIMTNNGIEINQNLNSILLTLNATAFAYLPALVVWSVVKRFGGTPAIGIVLGLMLISPNLPDAYAVTSGTASPLIFNIFGLELSVVGFQGSILPAIAVGILAAFLEKKLKKIVPDVLNLIVTPFLTLLVSLLVGLFVLGPILHSFEVVILDLFVQFLKLPFGLGGLIAGGINQIIVITGMQHIFITLETGLISQTGFNPWNAMMTGSITAQGAAAVAVGLKLKNKNKKALAFSAAVPAFLGITEPAIFGVNLVRVKPFLFACVGGAVGGMIASITGLAADGLGLTSIPGTLLYISTNQVLLYLFVNIISGVIAFVLTFIFYREKAEGIN